MWLQIPMILITLFWFNVNSLFVFKFNNNFALIW